jgi:RAB protein geranylgeranyltransferase component A
VKHLNDEKITASEELLKENRSYNIDLLPKLAFANGDLIKYLIQSGVGNYLEFRVIDQTMLYLDQRFQQVLRVICGKKNHVL